MITSIYWTFRTSSLTIILRYILLSLGLFSGPDLYFPISTSLFLRATVQSFILGLLSRLAVRRHGHMSIPTEKEKELARMFDNGTWDRPGESFGQTLGSAAYALKHVCTFGVSRTI